MSSALNRVNYRNTSVTTKLPGQVENNTGGFVYQISDESRLERFLILGTDGGTYYVKEQELTEQNVSWLIDFIKAAPVVALNKVVEVSTSGRSYRNSAALFVLALMLNHVHDGFKQNVVAAVPLVARTGTHVFELAQFIENLGGWGRAKRSAISNWYTSKSPSQLAFQAVKYRQRNGWTHRDLFRLSHPVGVDQRVGNFILGKEPIFGGPEILAGFHEIQRSGDVNEVLFVLGQFPNLPWETIPTQFLKSPEVWKKLFYNGQLKGQALVRNVTRLAKIGAFNDLVFASEYAQALADVSMIRNTRLHPVQYLLASVTYSEGQFVRNGGYVSGQRSRDWSTNPKISEALQTGFHAAFQSTEPANKRTMIGVDVSSSMSWGSCVGADLTAAQGSAAMAMVTARLEPYVDVYGFSSTLKDLGITPSQSFPEIMKKVQDNSFGWTDPSLLINNAKNRSVKVDTFIVITDNEVNHGTHPSVALRDYRNKMGIDAKLVVMGMTATDFTIADPNDHGMLDVVGFDANAPKVVSDFSAGRI